MRNFGIFGIFVTFCVVVLVLTSDAAKINYVVNIQKLALANNELAINLHRELVSDSSKNVFFSPLSISTALGMLFLGARGETAQELRKVLGYTKYNLRNSHRTISRYFSYFLGSRDTSDGYVLNSSNFVLVDRRLALLEDYKKKVQILYRAIAHNVDFENYAPSILEEINDWVKEKTNGKIERVVDDLSPDTVLALLNVVYFKGIWETPFDAKNTRDEIFYNNGLESEAKNVPMMNLKGEFPVTSYGEFEALELPYKGGGISMLILLPFKRDGLSALEEGLTPYKLNQVLKDVYPTNVEISLPKFKLEFEEELSGYLQDLGVNQMFSDKANFSRMSASEGVSVSQVLHKAMIEVNEEGSEAAAATAVVMGRNRPLNFRVENPFLFVIIEKRSKRNMVLFMGRVNNL